MDCQTAPLLRVCNNRPRGWTDHVATRLCARLGTWTNTGLSHNTCIYRASIASRDKNLVYLFVGHLRVDLKVLPSNFFYVVWNSVSCDGPLPNAKRHLPIGPLEVISIPRNGGPPEWGGALPRNVPFELYAGNKHPTQNTASGGRFLGLAKPLRKNSEISHGCTLLFESCTVYTDYYLFMFASCTIFFCIHLVYILINIIGLSLIHI